MDKFWTNLRQIVKWLMAHRPPMAHSSATWSRTKCGQMLDITKYSTWFVGQMFDDYIGQKLDKEKTFVRCLYRSLLFKDSQNP